MDIPAQPIQSESPPSALSPPLPLAPDGLATSASAATVIALPMLRSGAADGLGRIGSVFEGAVFSCGSSSDESSPTLTSPLSSSSSLTSPNAANRDATATVPSGTDL